MHPAIIVLAAGLGARFGDICHKLDQPLGSRTVLAQTLLNAVATGLPVVVVTTEPLAAVARGHVAARDVLVLPPVGTPGHPLLGMGFSIATGVAARPEASGWLVLPGDMPMVQPSTIQAVARQLPTYPVVYAQHGGRRGHPVGFGPELFSELATLAGDEGAHRLVARYPAHAVDVEDVGILMDIDRPEDLIRARSMDLINAG